MKKYDNILLTGLISISLLSLVRYINISNFLFDIFSQFPFQYAFLSLILMPFCLWKKKKALIIWASALFIFNVIAIIDLGGSIQAAGYSGKTFKLYSANLNIHNYDLAKLNYELKKMDPEMVLLLEVTPEHIDQIQAVIQTYPYHIEKSFIGDSEIGFVFLSKFPVIDNHVTWLSDVCNFMLAATIEIDHKQVKFYGVHAQRPSIGNFSERKDQFLWIARQLKEQSLPVIAAGDFNATPFSPIFQQLLKISGLRDSRAGSGWQPSWPTYFPLLWIPIDHMILSPGIQVHKRATGSYIGSDHYPVFAELSIQN